MLDFSSFSSSSTSSAFGLRDKPLHLERVPERERRRRAFHALMPQPPADGLRSDPGLVVEVEGQAASSGHAQGEKELQCTTHLHVNCYL